jgi:hypothetical protein
MGTVDGGELQNWWKQIEWRPSFDDFIIDDDGIVTAVLL